MVRSGDVEVGTAGAEVGLGGVEVGTAGVEVGTAGVEVGMSGAEVGTGGGFAAVVCSRVVVGTQVTGVAIMVGGAAVLGPGRGVGECVAAVAIAPPVVGPVGTRVSGDLLRSGCVWRKWVYNF